jgi:endonuclease I
VKRSIPAIALLLFMFIVNLSYACTPAPCWAGGELSYYYDTVDTQSAHSMRDSLHEVIDGHIRFPYTSSVTDTWDVLETADQASVDSNSIVTIYRNAVFGKQGGGNNFYNREHTWPKSYGFPDNGPDLNYPYTDLHHLFLSDSDYNFFRSNKPFADCDMTCDEHVTEANDDRGGVGGSYPGNSNWTDGEFTNGRWEVWQDRRGDIARAMFYMDVRYAGGTHGETGASEPDLILTDELTLIASTNTGNNEPVAYMGMLKTLLQWHEEDPVDAMEIQHHTTVSNYQQNRNPFVDHPEWVACVFGDDCPVFQINAGLNDAWYNPETDGQGFFITVFPDLGIVLLAWFTYDTGLPPEDAKANLGDAGHRWFTAVGIIEGNQSIMDIEMTSNGIFDEPSDVQRRQDGTIKLTFEDCESGVVEYHIPSINEINTFPIQRVAKDNTLLCKQLSQ